MVASVFAYPPNQTSYDVDSNSYNFYNSVITRGVVALSDDTLGPQELYIGASSNLVLEAGGAVSMYTSNGAVEYYYSTFVDTGSNTAPLRTDTLALRIQAASNTPGSDVNITSSGIMVLSGGDCNNTVSINGFLFQQNDRDGYEYLATTKPDGFRVSDPLTVSGGLVVQTNETIAQNLYVGLDVDIGRNLTVRQNLYAPSLSLWKDKAVTSNDVPDQVGYAFNINSNDQLELVRYARFGACNPDTSQQITVTQRVGIFGNGAISITGNSDASSANFDAMNAVVDPAPGYSNLADGSNGGDVVTIESQWGTNAQGNVFYNSGYVGIGMSQPQFDLHVNGVIQAVQVNASSAISASAYYSTSDRRLKNIVGLVDPQMCYDKINNTRVTSYTMNNDPEGRIKTGFIAQELETVIPDSVYTSPHGDLLDCKYIEPNVLIGYAVGAIQHEARLHEELQSTVTVTASQLQELKTTVSNMNSVMANLVHTLRRSRMI